MRTWAFSSNACMACIIALSLFLVSSECSGGQQKVATPPVTLPPLDPNWKELVYNETTKHATEKNKQENLRILFLDPPVPCTARLPRKGFLAFGSETKEGYGGVMLRKMISGVFLGKRVSVDPDATVLFYLIEPASGKITFYSGDELERAEVTPPIIVSETTFTFNRKMVSIKARMSSPEVVAMASLFRAIPDVKTFDAWPPYK